MKLKLNKETKGLLSNIATTTAWFVAVYALLFLVSTLVVFVTTFDPSPATLKLHEMLVDVLTTALGVALGLGLGQPFIQQALGSENTQDGKPPEESSEQV